MYQVMAMQNFVDGHGISTSYVLPTNLSATVYEPLINWPPGYSLLLSPFYVLFNHNYILAGLTLNILAAIALIIFSRRILKVLEVPQHLINLFTLFTGFFIYSFYFIDSSDAIAISFFTAAIYFTLTLIKRGVAPSKFVAATVICLFFCGLIKYLFIPVAFIIPVFIFLKGYADKNKAIKKAGIISFFCLLILFGALLTWQKINSGSPVYISESSRGFFPENLKNIYPAIPASFVNPDTISLVFPENSSANHILFRSMQCLHLLFLLFVTIFVARRIFKKGFKEISVSNSFFYISFFLSAGIMLLLVILSLRVGKEENIPGHWWTYVEEPRYYGLIALLLHIAVFAGYQYFKSFNSKFRFAFYLLPLLLLPETFRGIIFTAKRIYKTGKEEYSWQYEQEIQDYADRVIKNARGKQNGEVTVVTGSSYYINYRVGLFSHVPVLRDASVLNLPVWLHTKKPALLLVILQENDFPDYQPFLQWNEKYLFGEFRGYYFYAIHVIPH